MISKQNLIKNRSTVWYVYDINSIKQCQRMMHDMMPVCTYVFVLNISIQSKTYRLKMNDASTRVYRISNGHFFGRNDNDIRHSSRWNIAWYMALCFLLFWFHSIRYIATNKVRLNDSQWMTHSWIFLGDMVLESALANGEFAIKRAARKAAFCFNIFAFVWF